LSPPLTHTNFSFKKIRDRHILPPFAGVWYSPQLLLVATASVSGAQHVGERRRAAPPRVNFLIPALSRYHTQEEEAEEAGERKGAEKSVMV